ncbi:MAG: transporter substrate-binding domain-containing protein [Clostridia bacterium]|nr:transporter substrate-binding domain-containing protein [Clostridia bacterium]
MKKSMVGICLVFLQIIFLASAFSERQLSDLSGKRIGIQTGTTFDEVVLEKLPDVSISYYNAYTDLAAALEADKIDGFPGDEPVLRMMMSENNHLNVLDEKLDYVDFGFVLPKTDRGTILLSKLNDWIESIRNSGELNEIIHKWTEGTEADRTVPEYAGFPAPNGILIMATEGSYAPMVYYRGNELIGLEIDLAARFCMANGYGLQVNNMNFDGILPAVQSGKADFAAAGIAITEERKESVNFSEPYYTGGTVMMVLNKASEDMLMPEDFNGKRAGIITGSFHDSVIAEELPDSTISQYNNYTDMVAALKSDRIDYFLASTEVAGSLMAADNTLMALEQPVRILDIGAMFAKDEHGDVLKSQMDAFINRIKADGTLDEIYRFWQDPANESVPVDMSNLTGEHGTLQFATSGTKAPITFVAQGEIAGTDPDIAVRFCREYGYDIAVNIVDTSGMIPGIVTGMYDFALSDMVITDERKESINFSVPYHGTDLVLVCTRDNRKSAISENTSASSGIVSSFSKTFIREERWRLFVSGVVTTLGITIMSILFGTLLGFLVFMLCRNGNPFAVSITRFCLWLVQGMPMVVLLMILYYVVFGSLAISGIAVAVIGFTLTFGASVFGLIKMGVDTVDRGQYEAAYALGHTNRHTFFRIVLPQAIPKVMPAYKGEIVSLIKATAIVGYIAVQDLTKMGDIVRSRTYEAFFPLIAVTVIYFFLEGLISFIVERISIRLDPKKRGSDQILKGVIIHD